ncbi:MAG: DegT/DnrJ/EryC1/StrS family aminotransferase [Aureliella sp.]
MNSDAFTGGLPIGGGSSPFSLGTQARGSAHSYIDPDLNATQLDVQENEATSVIPKTTRSELAIHGGRPAFSKVQHVGCPVVLNPESFMTRIQGVLDRQWFTNNGQEVQEFESRIEQLLGVKHCVATSNGTSALTLTAQALGLKGEVILPSFTFIATAHAFSSIGLRPVFAEVDSSTACIDARAVRSLVNENTAAIVGVHLWGRTCDVAALEDLSEESQVPLLFDASHAFGVTHSGKYVGNFGQAETFSFHATKYISAGEGGAVTTNSDELASRLRAARNFGFTGVDSVESLGTNAKLNELCAALGNASLETLDQRVAINRRNFAVYRELLADIDGIHLQDVKQTERNNYQYVVIRICPETFGCDRDALLTALEAENVRARRYFYPGCHRAQPYAEDFNAQGRDLPGTDRLANEVLSLPTGPAVSVKSVQAIVSIIAVLAKNSDNCKQDGERQSQNVVPIPKSIASRPTRRGSLF